MEESRNPEYLSNRVNVLFSASGSRPSPADREAMMEGITCHIGQYGNSGNYEYFNLYINGNRIIASEHVPEGNPIRHSGFSCSHTFCSKPMIRGVYFSIGELIPWVKIDDLNEEVAIYRFTLSRVEGASLYLQRVVDLVNRSILYQVGSYDPVDQDFYPYDDHSQHGMAFMVVEDILSSKVTYNSLVAKTDQRG